MTFEELTAITKKTREELADLFLDETASEACSPYRRRAQRSLRLGIQPFLRKA